MINEITPTTTASEYAEVLGDCVFTGCTMLPDAPPVIAARERFDAETVELKKSLSDLRRFLGLVEVSAAMVAVLWWAWGTYGFLRPVSDATASMVRQAKGAAVYASHPGRLGVGENGKRAQRMRANAVAFGTWGDRS